MKETFYFTHDYGARKDPKLVKVMMKHGVSGLGIYWCLVEMLHEQQGVLPLEPEALAFELRTQAGVVTSVIRDFDLFKDDGKTFWSDSVNARLALRKEKQDKAKASAERRWEKVRKNANASKNDANAMRTQCDSNAIKESKGKESKGKENIEELESGSPPVPVGNTPEVGFEKKMQLMQKRQTSFYNELVPFVGDFPKELIRKFFNYWSEPNKSKTKMRFELERTWDLKRRLDTWAANDSRFTHKTSKDDEPEDKAAETIRALREQGG